MIKLLTTSQIAQMYGLADSTIRHYRACGRLRPTRETPGGHARYALADVLSALGEPLELPGTILKRAPPPIDGEVFAPTGIHDLRLSGQGGILSADVAALATRELPTTAGKHSSHARWGGRLLTPPGATAA